MKRLNRQTSLRATRHSRSAFSLIELLVVMVIIAILVGLLLPAIGSVRNNIRAGETKAEISQLETAIASFKSEFGVEPPSYLAVPPISNTSLWSDPAFAPSRRILRQIWKRFDFSSNGGLANVEAVELHGQECLVFFLGGVRSVADANGNNLRDVGEAANVLLGFSSNPAQPFAIDAGTRNGPFFDFKLNRVEDFDNDDFLEYIDTLPGQTRPYLYLSSYAGRGYKTLDTQFYSDPAQDLNSFYLQTSGGQPWKRDGFQLISAGFDLEYGVGGVYVPGSDLGPQQLQDQDNITNFADGTQLN